MMCRRADKLIFWAMVAVVAIISGVNS